MTKWEYCRILWMTGKASQERLVEVRTEVEDYAFSDPKSGDQALVRGGTCSIFGSSAKSEGITELGEKMAELGLDGWELVSHTETTSPTGSQFFFKRPIEE